MTEPASPTAASPAPGAQTLEVPIEVLASVYPVVASSSKPPEGDHTGRVSGECVSCGIKVSGEELRDLAALDPEKPGPTPKLDRLRLRYCARNTCDSRYYRVQFQPESAEQWASIQAQLLGVPIAREEPVKKRARPMDPKRKLALAGIVVGVIVAFFLIRYYIYGYRIPLVHEKREYRVIQAPPGSRKYLQFEKRLGEIGTTQLMSRFAARPRDESPLHRSFWYRF